MITGIDHLIILVDDLDTGIQQYQSQGFTVTQGGRHPYGTHNGLVTFQDGSYLELIAFYDQNATEHQWHRHLTTGGGLIDHAIGSNNLDGDVAAARANGLQLNGPADGARKRPDGIEIAWKTARQEGGNGSPLPFVIQDVTDRELRVPGEAAADHGNGVLGIDRLIVGVNDVDSAARDYSNLTGAEVNTSEASGAVKAVEFQIGPHIVELRQPEPGSEMDLQIQNRGDGPYAAVFYRAEEQVLDPARVGNARISVRVR